MLKCRGNYIDQVGPESTCTSYLAHLSPTDAHGRTSTMLITKDLTPHTACKSLTATVFAVAECGTSEPPVLLAAQLGTRESILESRLVFKKAHLIQQSVGNNCFIGT